MKIGLLVMFSFIQFSLEMVNRDEKIIREMLAQQQACWNKGDLSCFMEPYWHSDSLKFIGSKGITWGWKNTQERYEKTYPDQIAMGQLSFELLVIDRINEDNYFVVGKWFLEREIGNLQGHFSLLWRKIEGRWLIVADHSS